MTILSDNLKKARKANNLSQEKVAQLLQEKYNLKADRVMVSKWETGFQTPSIYYVKCLSEIYQVSMDELNQSSIAIVIETPKLLAADTSSHSPIFHTDETDTTQHHKNMIAERIINSNYSDDELNKIEQMLDIIVPAQKK